MTKPKTMKFLDTLENQLQSLFNNSIVQYNKDKLSLKDLLL